MYQHARREQVKLFYSAVAEEYFPKQPSSDSIREFKALLPTITSAILGAFPDEHWTQVAAQRQEDDWMTRAMEAELTIQSPASKRVPKSKEALAPSLESEKRDQFTERAQSLEGQSRSEESNTVPGPRLKAEGAPRRRGRGFAPNEADHRKVAAAAAEFGEDFIARLADLCRELDRVGADVPKKWKGKGTWLTIADRVSGTSPERESVAAYIRYRLLWLRQHPGNSSGE